MTSYDVKLISVNRFKRWMDTLDFCVNSDKILKEIVDNDREDLFEIMIEKDDNDIYIDNIVEYIDKNGKVNFIHLLPESKFDDFYLTENYEILSYLIDNLEHDALINLLQSSVFNIARFDEIINRKDFTKDEYSLILNYWALRDKEIVYKLLELGGRFNQIVNDKFDQETIELILSYQPNFYDFYDVKYHNNMDYSDGWGSYGTPDFSPLNDYELGTYETRYEKEVERERNRLGW